jgi:hypothetical protein
VKTLDRCDLNGIGVLRRYSLGCVVVELWFHSVSVWCLRSSLGFSCLSFFYLDLLCKGSLPSPCIGSAVVVLFIKRDESRKLVSEPGRRCTRFLDQRAANRWMSSQYIVMYMGSYRT